MLGKKTPLTILFWGLCLPAFSLANWQQFEVKSISHDFSLKLNTGQVFRFEDLVLPDAHFPNHKNQCYVALLKQWFEDNLLNQEVAIKSLEHKSRSRIRPKFLPGDLRTNNIKNVSEHFLKKGWASYTGQNKELILAQNQAKSAHLGLWGSCHIFRSLSQSLAENGTSNYFKRHPQLQGPTNIAWVKQITDSTTIELYNGLQVKLLGVSRIEHESDKVDQCLEVKAKKHLENLLLRKKVILVKDKVPVNGFRKVSRHILLPKNRYQREQLITQKLLNSGYYKRNNDQINLRYEALLTNYSLKKRSIDISQCLSNEQENNVEALIYDESCRIKGNISGSKKHPQKTYHTPLSGWYQRITPEACFATEAEASAAGFAKVK